MGQLTPQSHSRITVIKFLHLLLFRFDSLTFPDFNAVSSSSVFTFFAYKNAFTDTKDTVSHMHTITVKSVLADLLSK